MFLRTLLSVLLGVTLLSVSSPMTLAQTSGRGQPPTSVQRPKEDLDEAKAACRVSLKAMHRIRELERQARQLQYELRQLEQNPQTNASRIAQLQNKLSALKSEIEKERTVFEKAPAQCRRDLEDIREDRREQEP